jgi:hypothetical protein|tara:strand:+ start:3332 stop:5161 length:1830 start_codon:yes stop_codon:yes gene_type:complete
MAIEKTINLSVDSKGAVKGIEAVNSGLVDLGSATVDVEKGTESASKGFKGLGTAMKAAGIGLVIAGISKLGEVFSQNQKFADFFNTTFEAISIVFNDFVSFVADNTSGVVDSFKSIFENPAEAIKGLGESIYNGVVVRFEQLVEVLGLAGKAIGQLVKGEFSAAFDTIKEAGKQTVDVFTGVDDSFESVAETVSNYAKETLEAAKNNVELANNAQLAAAQQSLLVEKYDRQAEQLRQIRDEERNSITDRKKANDDLLEVLESQEKAMLLTADAQLASAQADAAKNNSIENQVAVTEALANRLGVLAQVEGLRSEQKANDLALDRELIELTNSKLESESSLSIERKRFNAEQIEDELAQLEALKVIDELYAEQEAIRLQAIIDNANAETQAKVDAQIALDTFQEEARQTRIVNQTAIDEEEALRKKEKDDKEIEDEKALAAAKKAIQDGVLGVVEKGIGVAKDLAGKNKKVQKALLIAENAAGIAKILINTAAANAASVAASPLTGGLPWVAINTISGALGVASAISATSKGLKALGGGSAGSAPTPKGEGASAAPKPPSFNIVGASDTNQLADAVAGQENQPVQAYVVANDVTSAQSLQNNIVEGSTID